MLIVGVLALVACHDDDCAGSGEERPLPTGMGTYITLSLQTQRPTRSAYDYEHPAGGEDGDGRVPGVNHENDINTLALFFVDDVAGVNAAAATPFSAKAHLNEVGFDGRDAQGNPVYSYMTAPILLRNYRPTENTHLLVAANMGNITPDMNTLGDLRDAQVDYTWQAAATLSGYAGFTMASADASEVWDFDHEGTQEDPFRVSLNVERTAARIDFVQGGTVVDDEWRYDVVSEHTDSKVADLYVQKARVVNAMQRPSYMLKRMATATNASVFDYLGVEAVDGKGIPANYVIEPTTANKPAATAAKHSVWFGDTRFALYQNNPAAFLTADYKVHTDSRISGFEPNGLSVGNVDGKEGRYYVMDYVRENTMSPEATNAYTATGVVLQAVYVPAKICRKNATTAEWETVDYKEGRTTFWRYTPSCVEMAESNSLYFLSEAEAEAYRTEHPEDVAPVPVKYTDGICYYNIWLRHANNGEDALIGPMEYGIVRNNIYQICIKSFSGPGTPQPDEHGPDGVKAVIYVRPWNVRTLPEVLI